MSIIVLGMEMPESCLRCDLFAGNGCKATRTMFPDWMNVAARPKDCPLRPLPEKHGRLIDADAMERVMSETVQGDIRGYPYSDTQWEMAFRWIDHQPTIVEAEGK